MLDYGKIGQKIRALRKLRGLSQEQLAESVWISVTHMSHIETGSTKLSLPVLVDLSNALGVGTDEILADALQTQKSAIAEDVQDIIAHCSTQQALVIMELIKSAKDAMDRHL